MLVTLSLLSLISIILLGATAQLKSLTRISDRNSSQLELNAAANYLETVISGASRIALIADNPDHNVVFEGGPLSLRLVAVVRTGSDAMALRDVEISTRKAGDGVELVQQNVPRRLGPPNSQWQEVFPVIGDLADFKIEYLPQITRTSDEPPVWADRWETPAQLPRAVRFQMTANRNKQRLTVTRTVLVRADS
jgi:hypothetical protein